jgi:hypothetical protein
MGTVKIALGAGLLLLAGAIVVALSRAPASVAGANKAPGGGEALIASTTAGATYCQAREVLPHGTSAIRVWLDAAAGPRVLVSLYSAGRLIGSGTRGSGWTGGSVTVPVKPLTRTFAGVTVCVSFHAHDETIVVQGAYTPPQDEAHDGGRPLPGRISIEYLRPGPRSWLSLVPDVIRHMSLGRAWAGTWIVYLMLALVASIVAIVCGLALTGLRE